MKYQSKHGIAKTFKWFLNETLLVLLPHLHNLDEPSRIKNYNVQISQ